MLLLTEFVQDLKCGFENFTEVSKINIEIAKWYRDNLLSLKILMCVLTEWRRCAFFTVMMIIFQLMIWYFIDHYYIQFSPFSFHYLSTLHCDIIHLILYSYVPLCLEVCYLCSTSDNFSVSPLWGFLRIWWSISRRILCQIAVLLRIILPLWYLRTFWKALSDWTVNSVAIFA